ncbi:hypothetical protein F2Q68_00031351 [Brassica cretica]|uniref:Uncharacterized protein n=1 Tax=Brassica cretica TaxID=69181 RepID=A0A8S9G4Q8_BRACR|nr:hypothetical protein F2Q68_00031351 [Brassica cretica]
MNWSRSWSKFCDSDRIIPSPSRSASGPWCWVGRSVMFLFDCWLAGWLIHLQPWMLDGRSVMFLFDCWPLIDNMSRTVRGLPLIARFCHRTRGITCALKLTGVPHSQQDSLSRTSLQSGSGAIEPLTAGPGALMFPEEDLKGLMRGKRSGGQCPFG